MCFDRQEREHRDGDRGSFFAFFSNTAQRLDVVRGYEQIQHVTLWFNESESGTLSVHNGQAMQRRTEQRCPRGSKEKATVVVTPRVAKQTKALRGSMTAPGRGGVTSDGGSPATLLGWGGGVALGS